jgi:3-hydroxyacyl-CoA dehydrogenase/enoyl-CoA hydratase/3-hydroxybutyryl-CoA epimerase
VDVALQIKKTPIVVNDSRGFFTSASSARSWVRPPRCWARGSPPPASRQAALQAGYPTGPLALFDEVSLVLGHRIREASRQAAEAEGWEFPGHPSYPVIDTMVLEFERGGRAAGAGFYDYEDGKRVGLWPGWLRNGGPTSTPRTST